MRRLLAANTTFTDAIPMSINNFGQIVGDFITATGDAGGFYAKVPLPKQTPKERTEAVIDSVARLVTTGALRRTDAATITAPLDAASTRSTAAASAPPGTTCGWPCPPSTCWCGSGACRRPTAAP